MPSLATSLALFAALLFIIVSSQPVYKITNAATNAVLGLRLADAAGNPTRAGLLVHALVFFAAVYGYARAVRV